MALKKCKECGNEVSTKADKCPNCGAPAPVTKKSSLGCLGLIVAAVAISFILTMMSDFSSQRSKKQEITRQEVVAKLEQKQGEEFSKNIDRHYNDMINGYKSKIQLALKELALFEKHDKLDYKDVSKYRTKIQIKNLELKAKEIPASNAAENLKIYKQLSSLDPENLNYNLKIDIYYEKLAQQRIAENEREDMLSARRHYDAYDELSPRMKEKVRINVLKDFGKHPENYYVIDGTLYKK